MNIGMSLVGRVVPGEIQKAQPELEITMRIAFGEGKAMREYLLVDRFLDTTMTEDHPDVRVAIWQMLREMSRKVMEPGT